LTIFNAKKISYTIIDPRQIQIWCCDESSSTSRENSEAFGVLFGKLCHLCVAKWSCCYTSATYIICVAHFIIELSIFYLDTCTWFLNLCLDFPLFSSVFDMIFCFLIQLLKTWDVLPLVLDRFELPIVPCSYPWSIERCFQLVCFLDFCHNCRCFEIWIWFFVCLKLGI